MSPPNTDFCRWVCVHITSTQLWGQCFSSRPISLRWVQTSPTFEEVEGFTLQTPSTSRSSFFFVCLFFMIWIFPEQGSNLCPLPWQVDSNHWITCPVPGQAFLLLFLQSGPFLLPLLWEGILISTSSVRTIWHVFFEKPCNHWGPCSHFADRIIESGVVSI